MNDELGALQTFLIIHLGTGEIRIAQRINQNLYAVVLYNRVIFSNQLIKGKPILKTGATTTRYVNT